MSDEKSTWKETDPRHRVKMMSDEDNAEINELWNTPRYKDKMVEMPDCYSWLDLHAKWEKKSDKTVLLIKGLGWQIFEKKNDKAIVVAEGYDFAELEELEAKPGQTLRKFYGYRIVVEIEGKWWSSRYSLLTESQTVNEQRSTHTPKPIQCHPFVHFMLKGVDGNVVTIDLDTPDPVNEVAVGFGLIETKPDYEQIAKDEKKQLEEKHKSRFTPKYLPLPTGFPALDKLLGGGIQSCRLTILAGATGIGKSSLLSQLVCNIPDAHYLVTKEQIVDVLDRIRKQGGQLEDPEGTLFDSDDLVNMWGRPVDQPTAPLIYDYLREKICPGGLLIIDGGEYIEHSSGKLTTHFAIEEGFKELSLYARQAEIAIVATLPINAPSPFDVPTVASVSPRKATEYASQVLCLFRDPAGYIVRLVKNSMGTPGDVMADFDRSTLRWDIKLSEKQIEEEATENSKEIIGDLFSKYGGKLPKSLFSKKGKKVNK